MFGPSDGYLYLTLGDGGSGGDPQGRAQDTANPLGKILRMDISGVDDFPADTNRNFKVPPTNPFASGVGGLPGNIYAPSFLPFWHSERLKLSELHPNAPFPYNY